MDSIVASRTKLAFQENGFLTSLNLTPMLFSFVHVICALSLSLSLSKDGWIIYLWEM